MCYGLLVHVLIPCVRVSVNSHVGDTFGATCVNCFTPLVVCAMRFAEFAALEERAHLEAEARFQEALDRVS